MRTACALWGPLVWLAALPAQARIDVFVPAGNELRFGEPFELQVQRAAPADATFEAFDAAVLGALELELEHADLTDGPLADGSEGRIERRRYRARALAVGDVVIAPFRTLLRAADGRVQTIVTDGITLRVASQLGDPAGDFEWPGDVREPSPRPRWAWWLAAGALAVVLFGVAAWRRQRRSPANAGAVPLPAEAEQSWPAQFAARLRALNDGLDDDAFHAQLVDVLRDYLHRRYDLRAEVRTSEELCSHQTHGAQSLRACLSRCDLVKFARRAPPPPERERARQAALEFVAVTAPAESRGGSQ